MEFHPLPKDDPKTRCRDAAKLEGLVGWTPKRDFMEELKNDVAVFKRCYCGVDFLKLFSFAYFCNIDFCFFEPPRIIIDGIAGNFTKTIPLNI